MAEESENSRGLTMEECDSRSLMKEPGDKSRALITEKYDSSAGPMKDEEHKNSRSFMMEGRDHSRSLMTDECDNSTGPMMEGRDNSGGLMTEGRDHTRGHMTERRDHKRGVKTEGRDNSTGQITEGRDHSGGLMTEGRDHSEGVMTEGRDHSEGLMTERRDHKRGPMTEGRDHNKGQITEGRDHSIGLVVEECPICMNEYRSPKLLECRHTFCSVCLKKIHSSAKSSSNIMCPVCRQQTKLPRENNVDFLLTNYFVSSIDVYICDSCDSKSEVPLISCGSCSFCLCKPCFENHGKSNDINNKCRDSDNIDGPTLYPDDPSMRGTIQHLLNGIVRSCYCGDLCDEFSVSGATRVTKILPVSTYSAWVLVDEGANVFKFNTSGHVEDKRTVGHDKTLDICWSEKDGLLAICEGVHAVLNCLTSGPESFLDTGHYKPTCLCNHRDGGLVVCCQDVQMPSEGVVSYVMIFNSQKELVVIRGINERLAFKRIISVAYNDLTQQVCVADEERNMVYLLGNDMTVCDTYRKGNGFPIRSRPMEIERPDSFAPTSICCDQDGAIFVYDFSSSSIHVISAKGKLLGMLLGSDEDHTGDPSCINFGPERKLWIGDMLSGHIRIYNIEQVFNRLGHRSSRHRISLRDGGEGGLPDALREMLNNSDGVLSGIGSGSGELSIENMHELLSASEQASGMLGSLVHQRMLGGQPSICLRRGPAGIEITDTQNPENSQANRMARQAFATQVLEDIDTQNRFAADGISVEEVLRACMDVDD